MPTPSQLFCLAVHQHQNGRLQDAERLYRQILSVEPNQPDAIHLLGVIAARRGMHEVAINLIQRAIQLQSSAAPFHNNLGEAYRNLRRFPEAIACYRRAISLNPNFAEPHSNLGAVFMEQGKLDEAVAACRRSVKLKPDYAEAYTNLGNALKAQGNWDEAAACWRKAMHVNPALAEPRANLGAALMEMGDLPGAERALRSALRQNPRFAFAHWKLAELLGGKLSDDDLAALRKTLADGELTDFERSLLHRGLALVLDARGDYSEAAEHLRQGNALGVSERHKLGQEYDPKAHSLLVARTIAVSTPDLFERTKGLGVESEVPVFVVGLPRSGTTLVEQILAGHSQVFGAGEITLAGETMTVLGARPEDAFDRLQHLDRETAQRLAAEHLRKLAEFSPTAQRIVNKTPENYLYLGVLAILFPRAKIIHCRRDLRDVAVSCWMTNFRDLLWANDQHHIAARFQEYRQIMEHWRSVLPVPMLELDYEETVTNLEGVAKRLIAWCGLPWEPACLDFCKTKRCVSTASAAQVRKPIFTTSVGRWKHYEQALAPLFSAIGSGT